MYRVEMPASTVAGTRHESAFLQRSPQLPHPLLAIEIKAIAYLART
jgi:hypothetical protein